MLLRAKNSSWQCDQNDIGISPDGGMDPGATQGITVYVVFFMHIWVLKNINIHTSINTGLHGK